MGFYHIETYLTRKIAQDKLTTLKNRELELIEKAKQAVSGSPEHRKIIDDLRQVMDEIKTLKRLTAPYYQWYRFDSLKESELWLLNSLKRVEPGTELYEDLQNQLRHVRKEIMKYQSYYLSQGIKL